MCHEKVILGFLTIVLIAMMLFVLVGLKMLSAWIALLGFIVCLTITAIMALVIAFNEARKDWLGHCKAIGLISESHDS